MVAKTSADTDRSITSLPPTPVVAAVSRESGLNISQDREQMLSHRVALQMLKQVKEEHRWSLSAGEEGPAPEVVIDCSELILMAGSKAVQKAAQALLTGLIVGLKSQESGVDILDNQSIKASGMGLGKGQGDRQDQSVLILKFENYEAVDEVLARLLDGKVNTHIEDGIRQVCQDTTSRHGGQRM